MTAILLFAATLLLAVLISERARRSIVSTAVLFLAVGFLGGAFGLAGLRPTADEVARLSEIALFAVLFTDGMLIGVRELAGAWRLPGRALLLGFPLTLGAIAVLARYVTGLPWLEAFLTGAVLAPTDPLFAAAIVGREEIPSRVRTLLNVESGLNDGLALPIVVVLVSLGGAREAAVGEVLGEAGLGVVVGASVSTAAVLLLRSSFFRPSPRYESLGALAVGVLVFAVASLTHANEFLAAFAAGVALATVGPDVRDAFHDIGDVVTELLKLAALLVFGALISGRFLVEVGIPGWIFALLVLVVARPAALAVALVRSGLDRRERFTVAWFGPKGFASVVYGLLVVGAGIPLGGQVFHVVAAAVALSMVLHSTTDVPIARAFERADSGGAP
ncbi:MAG TPA: cation:proton antiporter [Actinomycetota bacterium]|nr:cation:proton antiporter [Actinomycetota bacterium]